MHYQVFLSPQVKQIVIICNKHGIYKLAQELWNDLRLVPSLPPKMKILEKNFSNIEIEFFS